MSPLSLGLDGGGSGTRWAVCDASGVIVGRGELPAVSGHMFNETEQARMAVMAQALRQPLMAYGPIASAIFGVTGLTAGSVEAQRVASIVGEAIGVMPEVRDDLWIAFHAAFRPGEGHVVYCGTGSIGLHVRADGGVLRVGGRGMLIDDGGSAFWIGREALRLIWRRIDTYGHAGDTPLSRALGAAMGMRALNEAAWESVRRIVYGGERDAVAQLARAVAEAAAEGDPDALALLRAAGVELGLLARALLRRGGGLPVALLGRAAGLHPAIIDGMQGEVAGVRLVSVDAAATAATMAAGRR